MLTKEQEQAITNAVMAASDYILRSETVDAIVAAVKKYDEIQAPNYRDFKAILDSICRVAKEQECNKEGTDTLVAFKANRKDKVRLFNSITDMFSALTLENDCHVAIHDQVSDDYDDDVLPEPQGVYKITVDENGMHIGEPIGYCDCKTFKKG